MSVYKILGENNIGAPKMQINLWYTIKSSICDSNIGRFYFYTCNLIATSVIVFIQKYVLRATTFLSQI